MSTSRQLLRRHLKPYVDEAFYLKTVTAADDVTDRSLDQIENEEPSLMEWVSVGQPIQDLLEAHSAAMMVALIRGQQQGLALDTVVHRLDGLTYRLATAIAVEATMRARAEERTAPESWKTNE